MANTNRDQDRDQDNRNNRNEDEPTYVVPVPLNNTGSGASIPYIATTRPYEGLSDEMADANDDPRRGDYDGRGADARIDAEINDHLTEHSYIDTTEIVVSVKDGEVTLEGSVPDSEQKQYVEELATKINGVTGVNNQLKVQKPQDNLLENTSGKQ